VRRIDRVVGDTADLVILILLLPAAPAGPSLLRLRTARRASRTTDGRSLAPHLPVPVRSHGDEEFGWRLRARVCCHAAPLVTIRIAVTRGMRRSWTIVAFLVLFTSVPSSATDGALTQPKATNPPASHPSFIVRRQIEAEVSEVDRHTKVLRLKTEAGRLSLNATGSAAAAVKPGDMLAVDVALIPHADPTRLPRVHDDPPPLLTQRLRGSIAGIQRTVGIVALTTRAGRLTLELPAAAMAGLRTGDPVVLELAVRRQADVSALAGSEASRSKKGFGALLLMIFGRGK
jgi:hypothetical protein